GLRQLRRSGQLWVRPSPSLLALKKDRGRPKSGSGRDYSGRLFASAIRGGEHKNRCQSRGAVGSKAPWNNGKIIGPKPPLRTKNVWSIRSKLQVEGSLRDLAMFNFAIDSKLRGCDVVSA